MGLAQPDLAARSPELDLGELRAALARREIGPGRFARTAGLDVAHFSGVLHGKRFLAAETRKRIVADLATLGIPLAEVQRVP